VSSAAQSASNTTATSEAQSAAVDADDNPFRPSKDLRVEDEGAQEEKKMVPPDKPAPASTPISTSTSAPTPTLASTPALDPTPAPTAPRSGIVFSLKGAASKAKLGFGQADQQETAPKERGSILETKTAQITNKEPSSKGTPEPKKERSHRDPDRDRERDRMLERDRERERDRDRDRDREYRDRDRRYGPYDKHDGYYDRRSGYRDHRDRDPRDLRDPREPSYYREREYRERDSREARDLRDFRDPRDRDPRDLRSHRDPRDSRDFRDGRDPPRDPRDIRSDRDRREPPPNLPRRPDFRPDNRVDPRADRKEAVSSKPALKKVKRTRIKPLPTLSAEFAASESVYYRKPGNESVVGSGTYGKVFKGVHVYTKDMVALKKIRMEGERDGVSGTILQDPVRYANVI